MWSESVGIEVIGEFGFPTNCGSDVSISQIEEHEKDNFLDFFHCYIPFM